MGRFLSFTLRVLPFLLVTVAFGSEKSFQDNLKPPKVLWIARPAARLIVERLTEVMPVKFTYYSTRLGHLEFHHLTDKPLEEKKEGCKQLTERDKKRLGKLIDNLKIFDVLVLSVRQKKFARDLQKKIVSWVKRGGKLIYYTPGWEIIFKPEQLLTVIMPVKSGVYKYKAWNYAQEGATNHPLIRGLPIEVCGNHFYGPIYEPADESCQALTVQRQGKNLPPYKKITRFFYRKINSKGGEVVFIPGFPFGQKSIWGRGSYASYEPERPDDQQVWIDFMKRMFYMLTYGNKAYPVLLGITVESPKSIAGKQQLKLQVEAENFSKGKNGSYEVALRVSSRRLGIVKEMNEEILLESGEKKLLAFELQLPNLPVKNLLVEAVAKSSGGKIISKAYTWLLVKAPLNITLKTEKNGYLSGEKIPVSVMIKPVSADTKLLARALLVDYRGKVLQERTRDLVAMRGEGKWEFTFTMPKDQSGKQYSWWVTVMIMNGTKPIAIKRLQVYNDDPWNMRKQMQFSVWSAGTRGNGKPVLELYKDAGFNSLGFQGTPYWAERYGWRRYDEGTGINTFGVTIDYDTLAGTKQAMEKNIARLNKGAVSSRSLALVSLGEESGFKGGWGTRYYWKEDKAPVIPQKVFDNYLKVLYRGDIEKLNLEWDSDFKSFSEIPLERKYSRGPKVVPISGEAYTKDSQEKDWKIRVDVKNIDTKKKYIARTAPYLETYRFYDWYYQKYCDLATKVFRNNRNPVTRTIMSAPGGFYPKVDVYNFNGIGPFHAKERSLAVNELARRDYGDVPGFSGAIWAYFDLYRLWNSEIFSYLAAGNSHINYWVDFPLTFNYDLSHTRASFWTKRLQKKMKNLEPMMLHRRVYYTPGLGIFTGKQPVPKGLLGKYFSAGLSPNTAIYSAFAESGYFPKFVKSDELNKMKVVVTSYAGVIQPEEADALKKFVKNGGLLISTPWLASYSSHGNCLSVYPAKESGLNELLGFRLVNTSQNPKKEAVIIDFSDSIPVKVADGKASEIIETLVSGRDRVIDLKKDVRILARYVDKTPAILERSYGKGKVIYFNFVFCWSGWWNAFYKPEREGFRRLIKAIIDKDGRLRRDLFLSYKSYELTSKKGWWGTRGLKGLATWTSGDSVPYWATTCYADPSGINKYFFIFSDHRAPKVSGEIEFTDRESAVYDIFNNRKLKRNADGKIPLTLDSGEGTILAIVKNPPGKLVLAIPGKVNPGDKLTVKVNCRGSSGTADYGVMLETIRSDNQVAEQFSINNWTVKKGAGTLTFPVPLNQQSGTYRVKVTEVITGLTAEAQFEVTLGKNIVKRQLLQPFPPEPGRLVIEMSEKEFISNLKKLRSIYLKQTAGLDAKYLLSYFLYVPFIEESRHHILHRLAKQNWKNYVKAVAKAMQRGEYFYLTGEDLGVDLRSGLQINNQHPDRGNFLDLLVGESRAKRKTVSVDGRDLTVITIGKGKLLYDPISLTQFYMSEDFVSWQKDWLEKLKTLKLLRNNP